jgi:hypothetical protein
MAADEDRPGNVSDKAIIELSPIAARLREEIELDDRGWDRVVKALTHALMAGVRIGGAEVAAQAIESGLPVQLHMRVETAEPDDR